MKEGMTEALDALVKKDQGLRERALIDRLEDMLRRNDRTRILESDLEQSEKEARRRIAERINRDVDEALAQRQLRRSELGGKENADLLKRIEHLERDRKKASLELKELPQSVLQTLH